MKLLGTCSFPILPETLGSLPAPFSLRSLILPAIHLRLVRNSLA